MGCRNVICLRLQLDDVTHTLVCVCVGARKRTGIALDVIGQTVQ